MEGLHCAVVHAGFTPVSCRARPGPAHSPQFPGFLDSVTSSSTFLSPSASAPARPAAWRAGVAGRRQWLARGALLLAWAAAHEGALRWAVHWLADPVHQVQRMVLLGLALVGTWDFLTRPASPTPHPQAGWIFAAALALSVAARHATPVNTVQALAALLVLGGLWAGLLARPAWRQRLWLLALVVLCLPVQSHVDAHLGLPLRLWTAQAVTPLLQLLGVPNVSVESIIVTENGVADVASACSGVRTLWYAMALWLCARLLWPGAALWRWWLAGALSVAVAVGLNGLRVAGLVLALSHQAKPLLCDVAHTSLGLLALVVVAALNAWLCGAWRRAAQPSGPGFVLPAPQGAGPAVWLPLLALVGVALLPGPAPQAAERPVQRQALAWPAAFHVAPVELLPGEQALMSGHRATIAEKQRFSFEGIEGSLLAARSGDWRAHHAPELCLLAQGARIEKLTRARGPGGEFRVMAMQSGTQTAITWFQRRAQVVPDLRARLWAQLRQGDEDWTLVTVVADGPLSEAAALRLHQAVHAVVAAAPPSAD